jgi:hypothetical protein
VMRVSVGGRVAASKYYGTTPVGRMMMDVVAREERLHGSIKTIERWAGCRSCCPLLLLFVNSCAETNKQSTGPKS